LLISVQVDPTAPDLSAFPAFADVAAKEAVLRPGDVIFFPVSPDSAQLSI
jgi:hypothetical protein